MKNINDKISFDANNMPKFVPNVVPSPIGIPVPINTTAPKEKNKTGINNPIVNAIVNAQPSAADPNGSYTGRPLNPKETPLQDADDL